MKKSFLGEAMDQSIHFFLAVAAVLFIQPPHLWQAIALGFILALTREFTEGGNLLSSGSLRDFLFWTLGGFSGGMIRIAISA